MGKNKVIVSINRFLFSFELSYDMILVFYHTPNEP